MRLTFSAEKVSKNAIAESAVRPEGPDALRCSRQTGCAELATLKHAAPLIRLMLRSSAATRLIHVKSKGRFSSRTRPKHELPACVHRLPRSLAYEPPFSAEGNSTSGKPKRRNRTSSTSICQKALPVAVLSALFGYFLLQPVKSYSHQLGAAVRRNAFESCLL